LTACRRAHHHAAPSVPQRDARIVSDLVALKSDVLVSVGNVASPYARNATEAIPVVFILVADPIGSKLVDSLARPSGNITGLTNFVFTRRTRGVRVGGYRRFDRRVPWVSGPVCFARMGIPRRKNSPRRANVNRGAPLERTAAEDARRMLLISRREKAATCERLTATSLRTAEGCAPRRARAEVRRAAD
jgi:hypothetical protein